ncbi:universal stress protein [Aquimarina sp. I32.4]|uniref:universal stress protein n=1 Tax=Aquimarina sp. I32.4 TaxID=2053903 RepID=UPI000CDE905A|nr:universal stress protein [Aquimarina sp. I32.4]
MKRILVPTDFSNNAYSALFYATRLFKDEECIFYILNTFDVQTPVFTSRLDTGKGDKLYKKLSNESQEKLDEVVHAITRETREFNHTFESLSVSKKILETINKTIQNKDIDLVVMGTKGASGAKEVLVGSNTVKVIKKIKDCTVLAIPSELEYQNPSEIAFATDFKTAFTKEELRPITDIATMCSSNIRILHISEKEKLDDTQEHNLQGLKDNLGDLNYCIHWIPRMEQKTAHITEFIETANIDILCMAHRKHGFIESVTREPVIKKLGFHLSIPFLVIPE